MTDLPANVISVAALHNRRRVFRDRAHAGTILANMLARYRDSDAIVLGIPAGGAPVAAAVAGMLHLPVDVAVVSKLTLPWNTEAGYGTLAFDGTLRLNETLVRQAGLSKTDIELGTARTREKVERRLHQWRGARPFPSLAARTAILVDDGLASGFTMLVAIEALRHQQAKEIIVAVPTAHSDSVIRVARQVEWLYCANLREGLRFAVADAYENWSDVEEETVGQLLGTPTGPP